MSAPPSASMAVKMKASTSLEDDGTNFQMWKFRVQMVLGVRGPAEHEDWLSKDREALVQITLTLKDKPLSGVLYTTTSAEAL